MLGSKYLVSSHYYTAQVERKEQRAIRVRSYELVIGWRSLGSGEIVHNELVSIVSGIYENCCWGPNTGFELICEKVAGTADGTKWNDASRHFGPDYSGISYFDRNCVTCRSDEADIYNIPTATKVSAGRAKIRVKGKWSGVQIHIGIEDSGGLLKEADDE